MQLLPPQPHYLLGSELFETIQPNNNNIKIPVALHIYAAETCSDFIPQLNANTRNINPYPTNVENRVSS